MFNKAENKKLDGRFSPSYNEEVYRLLRNGYKTRKIDGKPVRVYNWKRPPYLADIFQMYRKSIIEDNLLDPDKDLDLWESAQVFLAILMFHTMNPKDLKSATRVPVPAIRKLIHWWSYYGILKDAKFATDMDLFKEDVDDDYKDRAAFQAMAFWMVGVNTIAAEVRKGVLYFIALEHYKKEEVNDEAGAG